MAVAEDLRPRSHNPEIAGRCPACKWASLFVGVGGHITCSRLECPAPFAADDALRENGYVIVRSAVLDEVRERAERAEAAIVRCVASVKTINHVGECPPDPSEWQRGYWACVDRVVGSIEAPYVDAAINAIKREREHRG